LKFTASAFERKLEVLERAKVGVGKVIEHKNAMIDSILELKGKCFALNQKETDTVIRFLQVNENAVRNTLEAKQEQFFDIGGRIAQCVECLSELTMDSGAMASVERAILENNSSDKVSTALDQLDKIIENV